MPDPMWTIANGGNQPAIGNDLNGYHIKKTATAYELYPPNLSAQRLAKVDATSLPVTFENVTIDGVTWDITVDSLPNSTDAGTWVTPSQHALRPDDVPPQSGEFTAQSGGAVAGEDAASSAKAY